jgi:hypothetical protein
MDIISDSPLRDFEQEMVEDFLKTCRAQGLPEGFSDEGVAVNFHEGEVFLTNAEGQIAAFYGANLEMLYRCHSCGTEGFAEELMSHAEDEGCFDSLRRLGLIEKEDEVMREMTREERIKQVLATHDGLCMDNSDDREELAEALLEMFEIFQEEASMELHITDFSSAMEAIRAGAAWLQGNAERIQEDVGPAVFPDGVYLAGGARYEVKDIAQRILQLADGLE